MKKDFNHEPDSSEFTAPVSAVCKGIITVLGIALTLGAILRALDVDRMVGLVLHTEQYLGFMLAIALPLVFLAVPAGKGRQRVGSIPWYDLVAAVLGFLASAYVTIRFPVLTELTTARPADGILVGAIVLVLLIEGLRRTAGKVLTIVVLGFLGYALVGDLVPGMLQGRPVSVSKLVYYLAWDSSGVLGTPMRIVTTIVIAFVLFGQILFKSGGSSFFTDIATALMGRFRGGQAKISVFASGLFGSISGSTVSNIATTGVITIPLMKKGGYPPHMAGAIEAVASTGGQLMPPVMGAAAFLMAEFLQVPYTQVVLAAIFPAFLYFAGLFIEADLEAARRGIVRVDDSLIPAPLGVFKSGWFFALPFLVLIYALFFLNDLPEKAAIRGIVVIIVFSLILGYKGKRFTFRDLVDSFRSTGLAVLDIVMIGAAAGMVIGVLYISGLSFSLALALVKAAGGNVVVLLLASAVVCIILGMGMPTIGVYLLLATLVAPALVEFGIQPMAAHMFIMYYGMMSMITPPVAIGAFAAATLSGADPMRTGWAAMRFGWVAFVIPFMFIASPTLLMRGNPFIVVIDFFAALAGVFLVSVGVVGYFFRKVSLWGRGAFVLSGLALVLPARAFNGAIVVISLGLFLAAVLLGRELLLKKRMARWSLESIHVKKADGASAS